MTSRREESIKANQIVHSALANSGEYQKSPHFRPENVEKVRAVVQNLVAQLPGQRAEKLLDLGCGTGFMINLVSGLFDEVHGVDITQDMLALVDLSPGNITLHTSVAESTPFPEDHFNMVTAYSFLDHLEQYQPVVSEAYRVLKAGGIFYSDLNPNRHFATNLKPLEGLDAELLPQVVGREIESMLHNGDYYESNFGIDAATLDLAEPIKSEMQGFDPDEFVGYAKSIGFTEARYTYDWYLGQAVMLHERDAGQSELVEEYLRMALPATRGLFKYVRFVLTK